MINITSGINRQTVDDMNEARLIYAIDISIQL